MPPPKGYIFKPGDRVKSCFISATGSGECNYIYCTNRSSECNKTLIVSKVEKDITRDSGYRIVIQDDGRYDRCCAGWFYLVSEDKIKSKSRIELLDV